ncbi:unnamed protein product [Natator depressus]
MKILCLIFAVLLFLLQATPGLSPPADTLRCISNSDLCHRTLCPRPLFAFGICSHGRETCCKGISPGSPSCADNGGDYIPPEADCPQHLSGACSRGMWKCCKLIP